MKILLRILGLVFLANLLFSSCIDDEKEENDYPYEDVNIWINDAVRGLYLWEDFIPSAIGLEKETKPEEYFEKFMYRPKDRWSGIYENYEEVLSELMGTPTTTGISPLPALTGNGDEVALIVLFVYKNSPAEKAGIKRGDFITKINGQALNKSNFYALFTAATQTLTMAKYYHNYGLAETGKTINVNSEIISIDPVIFDSIYQKDGVNIGYMHLSEFIDSSNFAPAVNKVINRFASEGIADLILDLRYNPGGELGAARHLASLIAPENTTSNKDVLIKMEYNAAGNSYYSDEDKTTRFIPGISHLGLNRVIVLTGSNTASASELTITGLSPYMEVITVGETTHGKYTAAGFFPDFNNPPAHEYGMMLITAKYKNANGYTDFTNGLIPEYPIKEDYGFLTAFGDESDPLLHQALQLCSYPLTKSARVANQASSLKPIGFINRKLGNELIIKH